MSALADVGDAEWERVMRVNAIAPGGNAGRVSEPDAGHIGREVRTPRPLSFRR